MPAQIGKLDRAEMVPAGVGMKSVDFWGDYCQGVVPVEVCELV
jgi:hypothetical protein